MLVIFCHRLYGSYTYVIYGYADAVKGKCELHCGYLCFRLHGDEVVRR